MKSVSESAESAVGGDQVLQLLDRVLCLGRRKKRERDVFFCLKYKRLIVLCTVGNQPIW